MKHDEVDMNPARAEQSTISDRDTEPAPAAEHWPIDTWLHAAAGRTMSGYANGASALVNLRADGVLVAFGMGATIAEACADACNDLQRKAALAEAGAL